MVAVHCCCEKNNIYPTIMSQPCHGLMSLALLVIQ
uniref:Uncharacterized protein n=1 Tax=Arundo donax TaxID=35708 RepID=A0A0A9BMS4_ARUDO